MEILKNENSRYPLPPLALGVDPGLRGSVALVSEDWVYGVIDLEHCRPGSEDRESKSMYKGARNAALLTNGSYLCPSLIDSFLSPLVPYKLKMSDPLSAYTPSPSIVVIEDVHSMPFDGVASAFKFGQTKGLLTGIISQLFKTIPIHYLKPSVWKLACGLSSNKDDSLALACEIFKKQNYLFERKKDADRAEAALLGLCGLRLLKAKRQGEQWEKSST